jgi:tRNA1(Val) A37 N6-methylase TrmN6
MSLDQTAHIVKSQTVTRDAFLGGRLNLLQSKHGFRAGLDSVLLGASVRVGKGDLLDLGAGVGTAALVALTYRPGLAATLAEIDPAATGLARENAAGNGLADRTTVVEVDVVAPGRTRAAAGLLPDRYAAVIANPPFFAAGQGTAPSEAGRAGARHMPAELLERWVKTAAASAAPGGEIIFILPAELLWALLAAFEPRFGAVTILPFSPRPAAAASRILVRGIKGSRAPLTLLAGRPLHGEDGKAFSPEIEVILRGEGPLLW